MLYITTRDDKNAYTAHHALHENTAPDGGAYVPFRMPYFSTKEISQLCSGNFGGAIAGILNKFFSLGLSDWDVDFAIGRNSLKLATMSHRMVVAELWHNLDGKYDYICSELYKKFSGSFTGAPSEWFKLAAHISVFFGIYCEICNSGIISTGDKIDISVMANDLTVPLGAIYARQMGLPIGTIMMTTVDDSSLWDLVHHGELSASAVKQDPVGYERLVHALLGGDAVRELRDTMEKNRTFRVDPEQMDALNQGLFCAVTGADRSAQNINSVYRSNSYVLDPMTALSIGGLQDYRAKSGESRLTLVLSCTSPLNCISEISSATGIVQDKLIALLKNPTDRRQ